MSARACSGVAAPVVELLRARTAMPPVAVVTASIVVPLGAAEVARIARLLVLLDVVATVNGVPFSDQLTGGVGIASHETVPSWLTMRMPLPAAQLPVTRDWTIAGFTLNVAAPEVPPPLRPVPAVTAVMSPPLSASTAQAQAAPLHFATWPLAHDRPPSASLSVSSANPAGLPLRPVQGAVLLKTALGAGASSCRGERIV